MTVEELVAGLRSEPAVALATLLESQQTQEKAAAMLEAQQLEITRLKWEVKRLDNLRHGIGWT
jgi:hypothetical protein